MIIKREIPPTPDRSTFASFDCEIFAMDKKKLHRPGGIFACMTVCLDGETVYYIDQQDAVQEVFNRLRQAKYMVAHNIEFDVRQLRQWATIPDTRNWWDTQLIEQLMYSGYYDQFGLDDLSRRYCGYIMNKDTRDEFFNLGRISDTMIEYACLDALYTWKIAQKQYKIIESDLLNLWHNIELPCLQALMHRVGFNLNQDKWLEISKKHEGIRDTIQAKYPGVNLNSPQQVKEWLRKNKVKVPTTNENDLQKHRDKQVVLDLLEYRKYQTLASRYGRAFLENVEPDGKIHCQYKLIGTETGRISSANPNMAQIPARDTKEFRECLTASPGNKLVIADYSAQEPRITAYLSQDKLFIKFFRENKDVHLEVAKLIFGNPNLTKKDNPKERNIGKSVGLGTTYGLTGKGLKDNKDLLEQGIILSREEADNYIRTFFHWFPGIARWVKYEQNFAVEHNYVQDILGRKIWINPYSYQGKNNAINSPIQASAATMMKRAIGILYEEWNESSWGPFALVQTTYDEMGVDVPADVAEEVEKFVVYAMQKAGEEMVEGIPILVDSGIGFTWGDKA